MAKKKKEIIHFFLFCLFGIVIGSLLGELVERILIAFKINFSLTLETPLAFDFHTIAFSFRPNLGSLVGLIGGLILFFLV